MKRSVFLAIFLIVGSYAGINTMVKTLVKNANATGAFCLDGTPPGYYWRASKGGAASNNWVINIFGGGWCYNEKECYERSKTQLGSSTLWPASSEGQAELSGEPSVNPVFHDWNAVHVFYCDGASFSGNREEPLVVENTKLYMRGHRVLDALLEDLGEKGLHNAKQVLLTGCSAGGLSTFLHADYIASRIPRNAHYKAMPKSGFFLASKNYQDKPVYIDEMEYVWKMQNVSRETVNTACVDANRDAPHRCMFAPATYPHIKTPILVINSIYDSWQLGNILNLPCTSKGPRTCNVQEIQDANGYRAKFLHEIVSSPTFKERQNAVFLNSCWTHCEGEGNHGWMNMKIQNLSMRDVVGAWYQNNTRHELLDCEYSLKEPYTCNPTC